MPQMRYFI